ncbi:MAG: alpha-N-arabinofuranosidase [Saprospiraceae bacterium]|nr:alpha-N-arabinofuranosidase [Saprospiraceae bacterium]
MTILTRRLFALGCFALLFLQFIIAQSPVKINLQEKQKPTIISKHIYGHFAEHLGRCIYDGFYVGEKSDIPNTDGVRNDIITALQELKVPNLRWPGGCFADSYHWKDGVGPISERPTIVNRWWGGTVEDNSFGTHDFLNLCEKIGAEPYLAANVGSGQVQELADWVEYVNSKGGGPMGEWRKKNGREKPWNVKYWGVGNEMWGCGGNMTPEYYANIYRQYATFMPDWTGKGMYRIASGASEDDYHWTEVLMRDVKKSLIEGVALHSYSVIDWGNKGPDITFSNAQYFKTMKKAWRMEELIRKHTAIMDKYDPKQEIDLIVDEWGGWYDGDKEMGVLYQQNTMRDAMIAGVTLNIFNNWSHRVKMANLAQTVNVLQAVLLTKGHQLVLTPTYHVMKMYNVHQDAELISVQFDTPSYEMDGESLPALSVSASKNAEDVIHVSLVNIDHQQGHEIALDLEDLGVNQVSATILSGDDLQAYNSFEKPDQIKPVAFKQVKYTNGKVSLVIPPFSIIVLQGK